MAYQIRKVAVLGAGVMGAAIAAHLANVGIPSILLDIVPAGETKDRNRIARVGLEKTLKTRPAPFYSTRVSPGLISVGNLEDDLEKLADVDWIVEAIVERLDIKQALYAKIEPFLKETTVISSNTSGLPAHQLIEGRSQRFREQFLITHFFNPVRYMRLLELVPTPSTKPEITAFMSTFGSEVLGKGVVLCKDTPNFIANRLGVYGFMSAIDHALAEGYTVSEVDTILGPNMGRPKSAIFRTADLSGLDTLVHVAKNLYQNAPHDEMREAFRVPELISTMLEKGQLGEKSGQGFYKKVKQEGGKSQIFELNLQTFEYEPQQKHRYASVGAARNYDDPAQRLLTILDGDDRASTFARETTSDSLIYAALRAEEIADDIVSIDNALKWGFNFQFGSFESWDILLQAPQILEKVLAGRPLPELVQRVQEQGEGRFYIEREGQLFFFDFKSNSYQAIPQAEGVVSLAQQKTRSDNILHANDGATLIDLGDGVACLEFHTKMNTLDDSIIEMMRYSVNEGVEKHHYRALVIGNEADNFSAGANVLFILMGAQAGEWGQLENAINTLQQVHQMIKYSQIPVVAAPTGLALGGGCEVVLHSQHTRALAETYIGLVETGVGLLPAGGGCKEMLLRYGAGAQQPRGGLFNASRRCFELIALATVGTSATEAKDQRFLRKTDAITINRDLLLRDAKQDAIALADLKDAGKWQPPEPSLLRLPGAGARMVLEQQIDNLLLTEKISEHDAVVARELARVLTGGECSPLTPLTEQQVLDLEREGFLRLAGMQKTHERLQSVIMSGRPVRN